MACLSTLPEDVLLVILRELPNEDVLAMRKVSDSCIDAYAEC